MRTVLWTFLGLVVGVIGGWQVKELTIQPVWPAGSYQFLDQLDNPQTRLLLATGRWQGERMSNKVNVVRILCDVAESNCDMSQANVIPFGKQSYLTLDNSSFKITQLDTGALIAVREAECIRVTLIFDRTARSVSLVRTKINSGETCSIVQDEPISSHLVNPLDLVQ